MPSRLGAPRALAPRALMPAIAAWGTPSPVTMTVVSSAPICARSTLSNAARSVVSLQRAHTSERKPNAAKARSGRSALTQMKDWHARHA